MPDPDVEKDIRNLLAEVLEEDEKGRRCPLKSDCHFFVRQNHLQFKSDYAIVSALLAKCKL